jgi:hypothetical protein
MHPLLDALPYPWSEPLARELRNRLVNTWSEPDEVKRLVKAADAPDWREISFNNPIVAVWSDVLDRGAREGRLRTLIRFLRDQRIGEPLKAFLDTLLADQVPVADPAPGGASGADFDDNITAPEALLFGDDLSESVGEIPGLLGAVERVMALRASVCKVVARGEDGAEYAGTGTLIGARLVLTNHHVLFPDAKRRRAAAVTAEFGLERGPNGAQLATTVLQADPRTIRSDAADDWAVITLLQPPSAPSLDLAAVVRAPASGERAFILQHPRGETKRLSFVRNRVTSVAGRRLYYLSDTDHGSSGAPVFGNDGALIGLHRAGGKPEKFPGVGQIVKNEGVRLDIISAAILGG